MAIHSLLLFGILFGLALTIGVGVHAHNHDRSGFWWGLLTFFTGIIGAVIYLLTDSPGEGTADRQTTHATTRQTCPNCSTTHTGTPNYCSECGEALDAPDDGPTATVLPDGARGYCSNCQAEVALDAAVCPNCDAQLSSRWSS